LSASLRKNVTVELLPFMDIKERRKDASKVQENYCGHHAMPKFAQVNAAFLKKTMLPRAPDCYFTPEDVALINHETGLEPAVILHWACNLLENEELNNEFKLGAGVASVEDYLNQFKYPPARP
jgi:hypothetical protein